MITASTRLLGRRVHTNIITWVLTPTWSCMMPLRAATCRSAISAGQTHQLNFLRRRSGELRHPLPAARNTRHTPPTLLSLWLKGTEVRRSTLWARSSEAREVSRWPMFA
jgi:hypothetical protein